MGVHLTQALEPGDVHLGVGIVPPQLGGDGVPLLLGEGQAGGLAAAELEQGGHGGVDVAVLNEGPHEAEKEGEQERADV